MYERVSILIKAYMAALSDASDARTRKYVVDNTSRYFPVILNYFGTLLLIRSNLTSATYPCNGGFQLKKDFPIITPLVPFIRSGRVYVSKDQDGSDLYFYKFNFDKAAFQRIGSELLNYYCPPKYIEKENAEGKVERIKIPYKYEFTPLSPEAAAQLFSNLNMTHTTSKETDLASLTVSEFTTVYDNTGGCHLFNEGSTVGREASYLSHITFPVEFTSCMYQTKDCSEEVLRDWLLKSFNVQTSTKMNSEG